MGRVYENRVFGYPRNEFLSWTQIEQVFSSLFYHIWWYSKVEQAKTIAPWSYQSPNAFWRVKTQISRTHPPSITITVQAPKRACLCLVLQLYHSTQFHGLCSTKSSSVMLQNLPYLIHTKTQSCFFRFSFCATLFFPLMNALVYVDIDRGIH